MARVRAASEQSFADPAEAVQARAALNPRPLLEDTRRTTLANLIQRADQRWVWRYDAARLSRWNDSVPSEADQWMVLPHITCPTLLVRGEESIVLSRLTAERMAHTIPHCRLVEVADSEHVVPLDNPSDLVATVRPFLLEQTG